MAAYVHAKEDPAKGLCIGYDTRFGSKAVCARVRRGGGGNRHSGAVVRTHHADTGAELRRCAERSAAGGIMITSSHNPAQWNGVKYKALVRRLGQAVDHRGD
jgi:phosphomannomutase